MSQMNIHPRLWSFNTSYREFHDTNHVMSLSKNRSEESKELRRNAMVVKNYHTVGRIVD